MNPIFPWPQLRLSKGFQMGDIHGLCASLYVPADHDGLGDALQGLHPAAPRSVIACTEDAIG